MDVELCLMYAAKLALLPVMEDYSVTENYAASLTFSRGIIFSLLLPETAAESTRVLCNPVVVGKLKLPSSTTCTREVCTPFLLPRGRFKEKGKFFSFGKASLLNFFLFRENVLN